MTATRRQGWGVAALVVAALLLSAAPATSQESPAGGGLDLTGLETEYATNPLGLDVPAPRFGWVASSEERAQRQSAYQVLVASDPGLLAPDAADVWDSGRVESDATSQVVYDGPPLESRQRYHWTVRAWDADGQPSDWAPPAWWETGLLDGDGWEARWIGRDAASSAEWADFTLEVELTPVSGAAGVFFRADGPGNSYMWQLIGAGDAPVLRTHVFEGGGVRVLDDVPIDEVIPPDEFFDRSHTLVVDVAGDQITTTVNGQVVDTVTDATHAAGGIGFRANISDVTGEPEVARYHRVRVLEGDTVVFEDDFSADTGAWSGGTIDGGSLLAQGVEEIFLTDLDRLAAPLLRRDFELDGEVTRARVYVAGLGYHELRLNGQRVGDHVLDPAFTDFDERAFYVTHDVTEQLRSGANTVGVELGRGFYGMTTPSVWNWHVASWHDDPKLALQLEVDFADGTRRTLVSDDSWQVTDGPVRFDSLLAGERHDARREQPGWDTPGFDASDWADAALVADPGVRLEAQTVEPIRVTGTLEPVAVTSPEPGVHVYDLGQNIAGWVQLEVDGPAGTQLVLHYGEKLRADGTVDNDDPLNHVSERYQVDTYTLRGEGPETFEPRFSYKGFQYVQVENYPGTPGLDDLRGRHVHTDVARTGGFDSSNGLFNQVEEATRWAILNNLHSMPTDTPMFEKIGWTADGQVMVDASVHNFAMPRVYTKWLDDLRHGQIANGRIPVVAPTHGWGSDWVAPEWSATYVLLVWDLYRHYGDTRVVADHYDAMRDYVDYELDRLDGDGLSTSMLGDWAAPGFSQGPAPEGGALTATAYVHRAADLLARMAGLLGEDDDAGRYAAAAAAARDALNAAFFDPETDVYSTDADVGYRQTSNVLPLAWGLVPEGHEAGVVANLVEDVQVARDGHLNTGVIGTKHLLRVLTEHGHADVAATVATRDTYPSWGHWFANGATTPFEFWELDSRSRGHMFLGTILDWFYEDLAGLRADRVAGGRLEVTPHLLDGLEHASAWTDTVEGRASSAWRRHDDRSVAVDVTVPVNTTATVRVPAEHPWHVTEGGVPAGLAEGVEFVRMDDGGAVFEVASGTYAFVSDPSLPEPACPDPDDRATVVIGGEDTGVPNHLLPGGCTVIDLLEEDADWATPGAFVRHVAGVADALYRDGVIDGRDRGALLRAAARSDVGRRGR